MRAGIHSVEAETRTMQEDPRPPKIEALLRHRDWIQRLARRLLVDPALAEDLSQEVWLAAIESPKPLHGREAGWLARVTWNLSMRSHRDARRREQRERTAARPEVVRSAADAVARLETERRVTEAVLALPEEFRVIVVLRYFENRTPASIAGELGMPAATVRTRLHRGLERLRQALDDEFDDGAGSGRSAWHAALLPLAGLDASLAPMALSVPKSAATASADAAANTGGIAMGTSKLVVSLSVLVVAIGIGFLFEAGVFEGAAPGIYVLEDAETSTATGSAGKEEPSADVEVSESAPRDNAVPVDAQVGMAPAGGAARQGEADSVRVLYGAIRGADGELTEGEIRMHPVGDESAGAVRRAFGFGAYAISGVRPGLWSYEIYSPNSRARSGRIEIPDDERPHRLDFSLGTSTSIVVRMRNEAGDLVPPAYTNLLSMSSHASVVATSNPLPDRLPDPYRASYGGAGRGRFFGILSLFDRGRSREMGVPEDAIGVLVIDSFPVHVHLLHGGRVVGRRYLEGPTDEILFDLPEPDIRATFATVRARIVDPSGEPVDRARIDQTVTFASGTGDAVDDEGNWIAEDVPPGYRSLSISPPERATQGNIKLVLRVEEQAAIDLGTLTFDPDLAITGRVLDENGSGVECSIAYELLDVPHAIPMLTRAARKPSGLDGSFEIRGLVRGRYRLTALAKVGNVPLVDKRVSLPTLADVTAGCVEVTLEARPARMLVVEIADGLWRPLSCRVEDEAGALVALSVPRMAAEHAMQVPVGNWRVVVSDDEGDRAQRDVTIGGEDVRIEIPVEGGDPFGNVHPGPSDDSMAPLVPFVEENRQAVAQDPVGVVAYGTIRDGDGEALSTTQMRVSTHPPHEPVAATQPDGTYAVAGLQPGDAWLAMIASDHSIDASHHTVTSSEPFVRHDAVLERTPELGFRLLDASGSDVSMIEDPFDLIISRELPDVARPVDEQSFTHVGRMLMDYEGSVRIIRRIAGPFHVSVVRAGRIVAVKGCDPDLQEVVVQLAADTPPPVFATLRFRCVDAESGAVRTPDQVIVRHPDHIARAQWYGRDLSGQIHEPVPVDDDGAVVIPNVGTGRIELRVAIDGRESFAYHFDVPEIDVFDLGDLSLTEAATLSVRFADASGALVEQSGCVRPAIAISGLPEGARAQRVFYGARGGEPARIPVGRRSYELVTLPAGERALQGYTIDTTSGDVDVTFVNVSGTPVHIDHGVESWSDALVRLESASGIVLDESSPSAFPMLVKLAPGSHAVKIVRAGKQVASKTFNVGDEPLTVVVQP